MRVGCCAHAQKLSALFESQISYSVAIRT